MQYVIRGLGGHNLGRSIAGRLCAPDEEFCDDACVKHYQAWARKHPINAGCLTNAQKHHLIDVCERTVAKVASKTEINAALALADNPCAAQHAKECDDALATWVSQNPVDAKCLSTANMNHLHGMCLRMKRGEIEGAAAVAELDRLVAAGCPVAPPQPQAAPPPPPAPPPAPYPEPGPDAVDIELDVYTAPAEPLQSEPTAFRKWGPVVGVLLIVAGGTYLLR